jgi:hypothetical protein
MDSRQVLCAGDLSTQFRLGNTTLLSEYQTFGTVLANTSIYVRGKNLSNFATLRRTDTGFSLYWGAYPKEADEEDPTPSDPDSDPPDATVAVLTYDGSNPLITLNSPKIIIMTKQFTGFATYVDDDFTGWDDDKLATAEQIVEAVTASARNIESKLDALEGRILALESPPPDSRVDGLIEALGGIVLKNELGTVDVASYVNVTFTRTFNQPGNLQHISLHLPYDMMDYLNVRYSFNFQLRLDFGSSNVRFYYQTTPPMWMAEILPDNSSYLLQHPSLSDDHRFFQFGLLSEAPFEDVDPTLEVLCGGITTVELRALEARIDALTPSTAPGLAA